MIKNEDMFNSRIRTENCIVSDLIFQKKIFDEKTRHWNKIADHLAEERRLKATGLYQDRYHNISHDILMKKSLAMFGHRGR